MLTHRVFRRAQRCWNGNVRRDGVTSFLAQKMQDSLCGVDGGTTPNGYHRVRSGIIENLYASLDLSNWAMFSDFPECPGVGVVFLQHTLDSSHNIGLSS